MHNSFVGEYSSQQLGLLQRFNCCNTELSKNQSHKDSTAF